MPEPNLSSSPAQRPRPVVLARRARCTNCGVIQEVRTPNAACCECGHTRFAPA